MQGTANGQAEGQLRGQVDQHVEGQRAEEVVGERLEGGRQPPGSAAINMRCWPKCQTAIMRMANVKRKNCAFPCVIDTTVSTSHTTCHPPTPLPLPLLPVPATLADKQTCSKSSDRAKTNINTMRQGRQDGREREEQEEEELELEQTMKVFPLFFGLFAVAAFPFPLLFFHKEEEEL